MGGGYPENFEVLSLGILSYHQLPLATTHVVHDNREFEVYFQMFYPKRMEDSLKSLKVHQVFAVNIGCS